MRSAPFSSSRYRRALVLLVLATVLGGCTHVADWKVHDRFDGVRSAYAGTGSLDILIVHGIGHAMDGPDAPMVGYSRAFQALIAREVDTFVTPVTTTFPIEEESVRLGTVTRTQYRSAGGRTLTFFELSWAEAVRPVKTMLLELDAERGYRERSVLEQHRARLNSIGKAFVNTHLADALIYAGAFGPTLRRVVAQAVCIMTRATPVPGERCQFAAAARTPARVVIVTHSLGSALVFDTISELVRRPNPQHAAAAVLLAGATTQVLMFANQLPLLELRTLTAPSGPAWLDDHPCPRSLAEGAGDAPGGLAGFLGVRRLRLGLEESAGPDPEPLHVVAFNDSNDLLTYAISERFKKHCGSARYANVMVTNADRLWLFLFANPLDAHTGHFANERIVRMLLDGGAPE